MSDGPGAVLWQVGKCVSLLQGAPAPQQLWASAWECQISVGRIFQEKLEIFIPM